MPLPNPLVAGKVPIAAGGLAPVGAAAAPAGGAAPVVAGADTFPFGMQTQTEGNWCWAATATSVSLHYDPTSAWSQCSLANAILALPTGTNCCVTGTDPACNVPWYLDRALGATSNLHDVRSGTVGFSDLPTLVAARSPLGVRVEWATGGGHFVVLHGWEKTPSGDEFIDVADPLFGSSTVPYADFVARYRTNGSWTHSYWTKS